MLFFFAFSVSGWLLICSSSLSSCVKKCSSSLNAPTRQIPPLKPCICQDKKITCCTHSQKSHSNDLNRHARSPGNALQAPKRAISVINSKRRARFNDCGASARRVVLMRHFAETSNVGLFWRVKWCRFCECLLMGSWRFFFEILGGVKSLMMDVLSRCATGAVILSCRRIRCWRDLLRSHDVNRTPCLREECCILHFEGIQSSPLLTGIVQMFACWVCFVFQDNLKTICPRTS